MILLGILLLMVLLLILTVVFTVSIGGAIFIVIFGDVIVCIGFLVWLISRIVKKRKK